MNYWTNLNASDLNLLRYVALNIGIGLPSSSLSESLFSKAKYQDSDNTHPETLAGRLRLKVMLEDKYLITKLAENLGDI